MKKLTIIELARQLGISRQMVYRHKNMGMPVDNLESATQWRKQNLNPIDSMSRYQHTTLPDHLPALDCFEDNFDESILQIDEDNARNTGNFIEEILRLGDDGMSIEAIKQRFRNVMLFN